MDGIEKIKIFEFDTSNEKKEYLIEFEDRYFEASFFVAHLIKTLKEFPALKEAVDVFRGPKNQKYSEKEFMGLIDKFIMPILESTKTKKEDSLLFKIELVSKKQVEKFSNLLKYLFRKYLIIVFLSIFLAFEVLFVIFSSELLNLGTLNIYFVVGIIGLMLVFSFIHELGHASACKYFNVEHGEVGFGLYLNFPVFYTDVSNVWKLPKQQRIIVNLAGVYFQIIILNFIFCAYFLTYNNFIKYFIIASNIGLLSTLNPFFKFDGYWIASDLLGVANLRRRSREFISYMFNRLFKRNIQRKPYLLMMKKKEKIFMAIYSIVVNFFFAFYVFYIIPVFLYSFFLIFPNNVTQLVTSLSNDISPSFNLIQAIFTQLLFFVLIILLLCKMIIIPLIKQLLTKRS
ncbi:MAG: hypothetical protein LBR10_15805 [Prevotellaceae bacterium]|jgi:putative peptide zinc metalloprotease protein|nr:hypothetical protein [Prevotellaceae bacterium]